MSVVVAGSRPEGPPEALFQELQPLLQNGSIELLLATAREKTQVAWPGTRVVPCPPGSTVPAMRLAGVRAASAPFIVITEDFCVPAVGWAESLLKARGRVGASVVGGPIGRNGGSAVDWALTLVEYGRFFRQEPEGAVSDLPSINAAYDAERLRVALPPDAEGLSEVQLHGELRTNGDIFWRVPGALMYDQNERPFLIAVQAQYHHGRLYGGGRLQGRGVLPRIARGALSCLLPVVLLSRIVREVAAAGQMDKVWRCLLPLSVLLCAWSFGEGLGSLFGEGRSGSHWT